MRMTTWTLSVWTMLRAFWGSISREKELIWNSCFPIGERVCCWVWEVVWSGGCQSGYSLVLSSKWDTFSGRTFSCPTHLQVCRTCLLHSSWVRKGDRDEEILWATLELAWKHLLLFIRTLTKMTRTVSFVSIFEIVLECTKTCWCLKILHNGERHGKSQWVYDFLFCLFGLFLAALSLRGCTQAFSSWNKWGLLSTCNVWASHCSGFSYCGAGSQEPGLRSCGAWA